MPKSRRKAAAGRAKSQGVVKDFVKKKERLGRKSRAANATDVSVRSRQVHVPAPSEVDPTSDVACKRGLSFEQLVVRCNHFSPGTRLAALNGLAKAYAVEDAVASSHVRADHARVLRIALHHLYDEAPPVRPAAILVLAAALTHMPTVRAFAPLLSARLIACLSHIRQDVQRTGAQAVFTVFGEAGVDPRDVFIGNFHVLLAALSDLLGTVKAPKHRKVVLDALGAVLGPPKSVKPSPVKTLSHRKHATPFYYHQCDTSRPVAEDEDLFSFSRTPRTGEAVQNPVDLLGKRIIDIVTELLPVHETKNDNLGVSVLLSSVHSLYRLLSSTSMKSSTENLVTRFVKTWSKERTRNHDRGDLHIIHNFIAGCAVRTKNWELPAAYVASSFSQEASVVLDTNKGLKKGPYLSVESLSLEILLHCADVVSHTKVLTAWSSRWLSAVREGRLRSATSSPATLTYVISNFLDYLKDGEWSIPDLEDLGWELVLILPTVVSAICAHNEMKSSAGVMDPGDYRFIIAALSLLARASRICSRFESPPCLEFARVTSEHLLCPTVIQGLDVHELKDLVAVLYYTRAFASTAAFRTVVQLFYTGTEISLEFCLRLFVLIEGHFLEFKQLGHERILLDLYTAVRIILEQNPASNIHFPHKQERNDILDVASRLLFGLGISEGDC